MCGHEIYQINLFEFSKFLLMEPSYNFKRIFEAEIGIKFLEEILKWLMRNLRLEIKILNIKIRDKNRTRNKIELRACRWRKIRVSLL